MKAIFNKQEELENLIRDTKIRKELETLGVTGAIHNSDTYDQKVFNYINKVAHSDRERLQFTEKYLNHKKNFQKIYRLGDD